MYGKSAYGLETYGHNKLQDDIDEDNFIDLAQYAPPFLAEVQELKEIYRTEGYEIGQLQHDLADLLDQCFLPTATWGLIRWEAVYGITTNMSLTYEQRREAIIARVRGQGTTTKHIIAKTAAAFSGGEVKVTEYNQHHHFVIRFVGVKGIPRNMQSLITVLDDIKPAHLSYSFEYTYTIWNGLKILKWNGIKSTTWTAVRVMEGV